MAFNINSFKSRGLTEGGARPSLFQVEMTLPPAIQSLNSALEKFTFTCRASSVPAATVAPVEVPYFGRKIKLAGDRTFADWSVTVMNDEDFQVRQMFEAWSSLLNHHEFNTKEVPNNEYKLADATVTQFSKLGEYKPIAVYTFVGMFPLEISAMDLDWDATNTIQTFNVTFAYDYWVSLAQSGATVAIAPGAGGGSGNIPAPEGPV